MDKVMELYVRSMVALQTPRKGQGLVEYALILVLISVVAIVTMRILGTTVADVYDQITTSLGGGTAAP